MLVGTDVAVHLHDRDNSGRDFVLKGPKSFEKVPPVEHLNNYLYQKWLS